MMRTEYEIQLRWNVINRRSIIDPHLGKFNHWPNPNRLIVSLRFDYRERRPMKALNSSP